MRTASSLSSCSCLQRSSKAKQGYSCTMVERQNSRPQLVALSLITVVVACTYTLSLSNIDSWHYTNASLSFCLICMSVRVSVLGLDCSELCGWLSWNCDIKLSSILWWTGFIFCLLITGTVTPSASRYTPYGLMLMMTGGDVSVNPNTVMHMMTGGDVCLCLDAVHARPRSAVV